MWEVFDMFVGNCSFVLWFFDLCLLFRFSALPLTHDKNERFEAASRVQLECNKQTDPFEELRPQNSY